MKGLFEWKLLAAVFAILIVASSALVSNSGVKDIFLNSTGSIGDMFNIPFGSLFSTPTKTTSFVTIRIFTGSMNLVLDNPTNITTPDSSIDNFRGSILFDFENNRTYLMPADSDLRMNLRMEDYSISGVSIQELVMDDVGYVVKSEMERIEIHDFLGTFSIDNGVVLEGNVSSVRDGHWSIG